MANKRPGKFWHLHDGYWCYSKPSLRVRIGLAWKHKDLSYIRYSRNMKEPNTTTQEGDHE